MFDRRWWLPLAGALVLAVWLVVELRPRAGENPLATQPNVGRNVLLGTDPRFDSLAALAGMTWRDVASTLEGAGSDPSARDRIIAETAAWTNAPAAYLRSLLLLAKGDFAAAAAGLALIPVGEIPPEYLYAPYRMYDASGRKEPNPFRAAMVQAVAAGQTSAVVAARVSGREGDLPGALRAYLRSDPAQWTPLDAEILGSVRWHAGLAGETIAMLKAALRSGRVPAALRKPLVALVSREGERADAERVRARVSTILRTDSPERALVVAAVSRQVELRNRFLQRDYKGLIGAYRPAAEISLPDETLLLLVLSAAHENSAVEFARWSRELRRRFPEPSTAAWLHSLSSATPR
jgi:hypothetical protein